MSVREAAVLPEWLPASLVQDEHGIWHCADRSSVSYPTDGNQFYLQLEDRSYWYNHRNFCIAEAVRRFPPRGPLVEVGGGNGFVALGLQRAGHDMVVLEPDPSGALAARRRGIEHVICGAFQDVGFADGSIAAIGLFDVLEHIEDDAAALAAFHRCLAPGGLMYIAVPAYQWLTSDQDRLLGHFRRYSLRSLAKVVRGAGFEIEYRAYFFLPLILPIALFRALPNRLGAHNRENDPELHELKGFLGAALGGALALERRLIAAGLRLPAGSSCLMVARKP
jgi:SAM-dependent methyltransferase